MANISAIFVSGGEDSVGRTDYITAIPVLSNVSTVYMSDDVLNISVTSLPIYQNAFNNISSIYAGDSFNSFNAVSELSIFPYVGSVTTSTTQYYIG